MRNERKEGDAKKKRAENTNRQTDRKKTVTKRVEKKTQNGLTSEVKKAFEDTEPIMKIFQNIMRH